MPLPRGNNIQVRGQDVAAVRRLGVPVTSISGNGPTQPVGQPGPTGNPGPMGPQGNPGVTGLQSTVLTTDASGLATFTFSPAYSSPPDIQAIPVNTGSEPLVCDIAAAVTTTAVTVKVWQAQKLPATISTLASLQNFDIFGGTGISGISVHVTAVGT